MAGSEYGGDLGGPVAHINVTPLVDVMLVLLVIFMVTAPMLQEGVDVNLPKTTTAALPGSGEQVVVSVDKTGQVYLGAGNKIEMDKLPERVKAVMAARAADGDSTAGGNAQKVYIKADTDVAYGAVMEVMGKLYTAGITNLGLVSQPEDVQ